MILSQYKEFVDDVFSNLGKLGIDISELEIDHIAYNASSLEDYKAKKDELSSSGEILHENIVGGKHVVIIHLDTPLTYDKRVFDIVEVVSPREGETAKGMWEHVEFLTGMGLENFMQDHPTLPWDASVIDRDIFPMLILKLENGTRAKFPRKPVIEEIARLK